MTSDPISPGRKRGRPAKPADERKGANLTFRVRDGMREWLEATAKASGRSISEEVERRVEASMSAAPDPFTETALRLIAEHWKARRTLTGTAIDEPNAIAAFADDARDIILKLGALQRETQARQLAEAMEAPVKPVPPAAERRAALAARREQGARAAPTSGDMSGLVEVDALPLHEVTLDEVMPRATSAKEGHG